MLKRSPDSHSDYLTAKTTAPRRRAAMVGASTLPSGREAELAVIIGRVHAQRGDLASAAAGIAAGAVQLLTEVDLAGLYQVGHDHAITTLGASAPAAAVLGQVQQQQRTGPCLTFCTDQIPLIAPDLATEGRWPRFVAAARDAGIGGILTVGLSVAGQPLGVLAVYSRTAGVLDAAAEAARLYAAHASVVLDAARERGNLRVAIDRRDQIGQAKGILMERHKITDGQAFALLVRTSQHTNTPLRLVVQNLLQSGQLPDRAAAQ